MSQKRRRRSRRDDLFWEMKNAMKKDRRGYDRAEDGWFILHFYRRMAFGIVVGAAVFAALIVGTALYL